MRVTGSLFVFLWLACFASPARADDSAKIEFFENRIRPLFAQHCYGCHSGRAQKANGGLQLDSIESIDKGGDSGPAIDRTHVTASLILKAISGKDEELSPMPPVGDRLTNQQVEDIKRWIEDGAVYPANHRVDQSAKGHWAFEAVSKPIPPQVSDSTWPRTDIDRFLLGQMEANDLRPAKDASWETIARRLSHVLIGLPLTESEFRRLEASVALSGKDVALDRFADQLLDSKQFGIRWARHWMDLVRYSESAGHEYDYEIEGAWRYRDYLVRALNIDLPYDRFVEEHLCGDLLAPRILDGRNESLLGTGWWLLQEAPTSPVDILKDEAERLDNQLDVLGKAFQGLTVGCARCHDHKFDPIPTREYYGLFGIAAASPGLRCWSNEPAIAKYANSMLELRREWSKNRGAKLEPSVGKPTSEAAVGANAKHWPATLADSATQVIADFTNGKPEGALCFGTAHWISESSDASNGLAFTKPSGVWAGLLSSRLPAIVRTQQFTVEREYIDVLVAGEDATVQVLISNFQMIRDPIYHPLRKKIKKQETHWLRIPVGRWRGLRAQVEVFTGTVDGSHRILHTKDTHKSMFGCIAVLQTDAPESLPIPESLHHVANASSELEWKLYISELEKQIPSPERFIGLGECDGKDVPVYRRGDPALVESSTVPRAFLTATHSPSLSVQQGSGRREVAEWIISEKNPLTARVIVNRVWHHLFGRGLVPTVDNFGLMGERPSHPELLDYLANRLVQEHQWRLKPLIREILCSRVFRIENGRFPESDATNRWLSRFPVQRMSGEAIRDSILRAAGNLDESCEGESIAVPHRFTGTGSDSGNNDAPNGPVDGRRRRSLYLSSRRNYPSVFLDVFDKPTSLNTFGKRDVTSVPTQSLTLLNDPFVQEQADLWASRMATSSTRIEEKLDSVFIRSFARHPTEEELVAAKSWLKESQQHDSIDGGPSQDALIWSDFLMSIYNSKEFIYVP